jgi:predicted nucleotidyltransferase
MTLDQLRGQWRGKIARLARRHGARNVRVFGSIARGQDTSASDLDLLVDFAPGCSLLDLIGLEQDLEDALGMRVDVVTEDGLSPYLRDDILKQAVPL